MYRLLLVGSGADPFAKLSGALQADDRVGFTQIDSGGEALAELQKEPIDLVVAAEQLPDMTGLSFAEKLVVQNPLINCALVSSLDEADFHEASEGLGILAKLSPHPDENQASDLLQKLERIVGPARQGASSAP